MRLWQHLVNQQAAVAGGAWRYWRIFIETSNGGTYVALGEVELRASVGGATLMTAATPVLASTTNGAFAAERTVDGDTSTQWRATAATNQWLRFDLGVAQAVAQVALYPQGSLLNRSPKDFIIQGSDDGTTFTDVKAFTNQTGWTAAGRTFDL